ncbi:MAG: hypothetical protein ACOX52_16885 [Verrucomicrobiota bacterium]
MGSQSGSQTVSVWCLLPVRRFAAGASGAVDVLHSNIPRRTTLAIDTDSDSDSDPDLDFDFDRHNDLTDRQPRPSYSPHHRVRVRVPLRWVRVRFWAEPEPVRKPHWAATKGLRGRMGSTQVRVRVRVGVGGRRGLLKRYH